MSSILENPHAAIASRLQAAHRPAILATADAAVVRDILLPFAERWQLPVFTAPDFPNLFPHEHRLAAHHAGFGAGELTERAVDRCDALLILGAVSRFCLDGFLADRKRCFLQLVEQEAQLMTVRTPDLVGVGPLGKALAELTALLPTSPRRAAPSWFLELKAEHDRPVALESFNARPGVIHPCAAVRVMREELPTEANVAVDVGEHTAFFLNQARLGPGHRPFIEVELSACMGHPFSASLGLRLGNGLKTLALVGDGGYRMVSAETHTAVEERLSGLVTVVWENGGFGMVQTGFEARYGRGHELAAGQWRSLPDFASIARGWGAHAIEARDLGTLRWAVRAGFSSPAPVVVIAHIDPTVKPPVAARLRQLPGVAGTRSSK